MARPKRPALHPRLIEFRKARGLTQEQVAERIGISADMVRRHERGLAHPIEPYRKRYSALYQASQADLGLLPSFAKPTGSRLSTTTDVDALLAEIVDSATSDDAICRLAELTSALAESHTQVRAQQVFAEVVRTHRQVRQLASRRQRLSQTRELYRIESDLLAHGCLLLGDLRKDTLAEKYGATALALASEAGSNQSIARSALAKTLRWEGRLVESASMAQIGYESSPETPIRIQLASQEANAAALLGDAKRAKEALQRSQLAAEQCSMDSGVSAWSFPAPRQAIFALSVSTKTDDPDEALRAAEVAHEAWRSGVPMVAATWAQIRVGAGIAHLIKGSLDGAVEQVTPVLSLQPELRVSTVTAYMDDLDLRLRDPRLYRTEPALDLREAIREFNAAALTSFNGSSP